MPSASERVFPVDQPRQGQLLPTQPLRVVLAAADVPPALRAEVARQGPDVRRLFAAAWAASATGGLREAAALLRVARAIEAGQAANPAGLFRALVARSRAGIEPGERYYELARAMLAASRAPPAREVLARLGEIFRSATAGG